MALFRRRFADLIARQLDLFAGDHREALETLSRALEAHRSADRDEAEETFGDYQDQVDWAADDLATLRETYAATLPEDNANAYRRAFDRAARSRFPQLAGALGSGDTGA